MTVYIQFGGVQHPETFKRSLSSVTSFVPFGPFRFIIIPNREHCRIQVALSALTCRFFAL